MPDEENKDTQTDTITEKPETKPENDSPTMEELVAQQVALELKDIKGNLDKAYAARDDAQKKVAEFELAQTEAETARLKEEGKHKEAFELEMAQAKAREQALKSSNIKLTRDIEIKSHLAGYNFKSESAADMAYNSLVTSVSQNDDGEWLNKSGKDLTTHVNDFMSSEDNSFLLKPAVNTGTQETHHKTPQKPTSVFKMSQADVLAAVEKGEL